MTSALAVAIERRDWELAALCLLVGITRAAEALPPEAIDALIEALSGEEEPRRTGRRPRRSGCRGRS